METKLITYKIDCLLAKSPSILRIGTAVWPLRIVSLIMAPITFIIGIILVMAAFAFLHYLEEFKGVIYNISNDKLIQDAVKMSMNGYIEKFESYAILLLIGGIGMLISGILFFVIAWLAKLVKNRNIFISETKNILTGIKSDLTA